MWLLLMSGNDLVDSASKLVNIDLIEITKYMNCDTKPMNPERLLQAIAS
jgi:hypothetical protein